MIDLQRFATEETVIMPIINGLGRSGGRLVKINCDSYWYQVRLGSKSSIIRPATMLEIHKTLQSLPYHLVYAFGHEGVPLNFDVFKRLGYDKTIPVHLMNLPLFSIAKVVQWEDKNFYYFDEDNSSKSRLVRGVKSAFDEDKPLGSLKGVSPELRYYFLLGSLQKESFRALEELAKFVLSREEEARRIAAIREHFPNRVRDAIANAGGEFGKIYRSGRGYMVEWTVGGQTVKSTIRDDLRIISAGFCLSGHDREHTMNSIIHLAKMYQEDRDLFITRE